MKYYETGIKDFIIRSAEEQDAQLILSLIKGLAEYEKMSADVINTPEMIKHWIFEKKYAEVLIGEYEGKPVGFALFFHNYSTFVGRAGLYIEDLYLHPSYRGKGFGKAFFTLLAQIAVERGCGRMEWSCLDWNKPSIDFYISMGSIPMDEWTVYRLSGDALEKLGKK